MPRSSGSVKKLQTNSRRAAFGERLRAVIQERGWTLSEAARQVREQLPDGAKFTPANISHYVSGRSLPRPLYLEALTTALGVDAGDLMSQDNTPTRKTNGSQSEHVQLQQEEARETPALHMQDLGDRVRLQINQELPWPVALKVLRALKGSSDSEA